MWPQYLHQPKIIHSAFGENIPKLEKLRLTQILLDGGGRVALGLQRHGLPEGSPSRWREKGYDMLEFRFSFCDAFDVSIAGDAFALGTTNLALELDEGAARLKPTDAAFTFALKFRLVQLDLHPFNMRVAEDYADRWFRRY